MMTEQSPQRPEGGGIMRDTHITLAVRETDTGPQQTFLFHVLVDGEVVASNQSLPPGEAKAVRQFVDRYNALFEQGGQPRAAAENLNALGADLFSLWLGQIWDKVQDIVHLTGHGIVARQCPDCGQLNAPGNTTCGDRNCAAALVGVPALGYFAFEDERGQTDMRSSVEIRQELFGGSGVQCVFVSGCQSGKAPPVAALGGICQGLVGDEVPLAIGWAASVADNTATQFAHTFYNTLAASRPVDRALTLARQAIRRTCQEQGDPSWTLPVLYAATAQGLIFDPDLRRPSQPPSRPTVVQQALPGMTEGYAEHFVGRRREQQRLLPALRQGRFQTVLITGLGGAGKSTLATRLARKLEADGFTLIPLPSSRDNPLSAARLLQTCGDAFLAAGLRDAYATLRDADLPVDDRLRLVVTTLNQGRFVLVLDNFEVNLDEATRRILDQELAGFYAHMLNHLSGGSRALITSRYPPADVPALPPTTREEPLAEFREGPFLKFLLRDPEVERRYRAGELPHALLGQLHHLLGGTPRFLAQIRQAVQSMPVDELRRELAAVHLPSGDDPGALQAACDAYCQEIFTARLYSYLEADSRQALSRASVYGIPITLEGLAAVTGAQVERLRLFTREWQEYALAYPEREGAPSELWTTYGLLRGWLLARLDPDERRPAHRAAGDFLHELDRQDREGELALLWIDCLLEARAQYLAAGDYEQAREVTERISGSYRRQGLYLEIQRLNQELLEYEEHPKTLAQIAWAHLDRAEYVTAREWYQRMFDAAKSTNDYEAARALHGLATIDVHVGEYGAAREKFQQALTTRQQIGDRAGEAATFYQLGFLAAEQGHLAEGVRLVALCFLIDQSIGHGDTESDLRTVTGMATQLNYTQEQFQAMMQEVAEAYRQDRGGGLVRGAELGDE
jgi:tetratricopeptide (TPR) repeat protein